MKSFAVLCLVLVLGSTLSEACKCMPIVDRNNICSSDFVGIVRVKSETVTGRRRLYEILVTEVWRMVRGRSEPVVIVTSESSASCGVGLADQSENLVTGKMDAEGRLSISSCGSIVVDVNSLTNERKDKLKKISYSCSDDCC